MMHFAAPLLAYAALVGPSSPRAPVPRSAVRMADSGPIAQALKELKTKYEVPWLAEGDGSPSNKVNMPEYLLGPFERTSLAIHSFNDLEKYVDHVGREDPQIIFEDSTDSEDLDPSRNDQRENDEEMGMDLDLGSPPIEGADDLENPPPPPQSPPTQTVLSNNSEKRQAPTAMSDSPQMAAEAPPGLTAQEAPILAEAQRGGTRPPMAAEAPRGTACAARQ